MQMFKKTAEASCSLKSRKWKRKWYNFTVLHTYAKCVWMKIESCEFISSLNDLKLSKLIRLGLFEQNDIIWKETKVDNISTKWIISQILKLTNIHFTTLDVLLHYLSRPMTKPTKWHVSLAKTQISLGIRPVWSESSLSAWRNIGSLAIHWAHCEDPADAQADRGHRSFCWLCHEAAHLCLLDPKSKSNKQGVKETTIKCKIHKKTWKRNCPYKQWLPCKQSNKRAYVLVLCVLSW